MVSQKKMVKRVRLLTVGGVVLAVLLILGVLWAMNFQQERLMDPPVVSVNGDVIYSDEVWAEYNRLPANLRQENSPQVVLEQMIDQKLILQYASSQGVVISDEQLQAAVDQRLSFYGTTRQQLSELLEAQGESFDDFVAGVHDEVVLEVFISEVLIPQVSVSDSDIQQYYEQNIESFSASQGEVRIRHILVSSEQEAIALRQEADSGVDFAALASAYSTDSAPRGGDLGFVSEQSALVEPFKSVALSLSVNEVSTPTQTEFGWHLIKREADVIPLREARSIIATRLQEQRAQQRFFSLLAELRENATIRYYSAAESFESA